MNSAYLTRRALLAMLSATSVIQAIRSWAGELGNGIVAPQPYFASVNRALETLAKLGSPITAADLERISALSRTGNKAVLEEAETILNRYTLARIEITSDGYAHTQLGGAPKTLIEQGWSAFLVRVSNPVGTTTRLSLTGDHASPTSPSTGAGRTGVPDTVNPSLGIATTWFRSEMYVAPPMSASLSGAAVEYQVVQLFSRDHGPQQTDIDFFSGSESDVGVAQYAQWVAPAYRRGAHFRFDCLPSRDVYLRVRDWDGRGCMASLTIKDKHERVYPLQAMRLAPDMTFHPQIYRADGETVRLPDGEYTVLSKRGPEYLQGRQTIIVGDSMNRIDLQLQRWINPADWGWYSGDPHIHASGCAHYEHPTEGVTPETMIRLVRGEALSVGEILSWGGGWYYQTGFFTGRAISPPAALEHPDLQVANNTSLRPRPTEEDSESLLRYDVEISGFPSSHCGHLILLRLQDQNYPGTKFVEDWPSWNLPILKWAKTQGAVVGYAHCGNGMAVSSTELPNYEIPAMDYNGTQEAIVDVTHGVIDFLSGCDTGPVAELNAWYHLLNCGFRLALIGETDYPCFTGQSPGVGRTYVHLEQRPTNDAGYEEWVHNLQKGKVYCGDGRSHFLDFKVNGFGRGDEELLLPAPQTVSITALIAARLEAEPDPNFEPKLLFPGWGWNIELARIGKSREVAVELVVNGMAVEKHNLLADGSPKLVNFKTQIARSSWVALRILPSSHTCPIFVEVAKKPIRASRRSAQWCRQCVDKLWQVKSPFIREAERAAAAEAFDHARKAYESIVSESELA